MQEFSYKSFGSGENVIFLHGWNQSKETFDCFRYLEEGFKVYCLDLMGFGESSEPSTPTLDYYVECLHSFIIDNKISNPIIIGHSFGG